MIPERGQKVRITLRKALISLLFDYWTIARNPRM